MNGIWQLWEIHFRARSLAISAAMIAAIALTDWRTAPYVSIGFLYVFPIMLASGFLNRGQVILMALVCCGLTEAFSDLRLSDAILRSIFVMLGFSGTGLFFQQLVKTRRLSIAHVASLEEQMRSRNEAEERFRVLVETSPAGIVTIDQSGSITQANGAARELLAPVDGALEGQPVGAFLPDLYHALRRETSSQFRTSMQCEAHRGDGERFLAEVWFSTYVDRTGPKLAAIIADVSEDVREPVPQLVLSDGSDSQEQDRKRLSSRELEVLRLVFDGFANKEIAARLELSESSVKNTLQQLFNKAGVRSRAQLVRVALDQYRDML